MIYETGDMIFEFTDKVAEPVEVWVVFIHEIDVCSLTQHPNLKSYLLFHKS